MQTKNGLKLGVVEWCGSAVVKSSNKRLGGTEHRHNSGNNLDLDVQSRKHLWRGARWPREHPLSGALRSVSSTEY